MTVLDIFNFLNKMAPFNTKEGFDNVGLLVGSYEKKVFNVLVCLDVTEKVLEEAVEKKAELIISHHPIIFNPLKNVLQDSLVYNIIKKDISVICAHTNLDKAEFGVSFNLAKKLELLEIEILEDSDEVGRIGNLKSALSFEEFIVYVSKKLDAFVRGVKIEKKIKRVAVVSGAGSFLLDTAIKQGADAFVTGESKHEIFLKAKENSCCFIDATHFKTENLICEPLVKILSEEFNSFGVNFYVSKQKSPFYICYGEKIWD